MIKKRAGTYISVTAVLLAVVMLFGGCMGQAAVPVDGPVEEVKRTPVEVEQLRRTSITNQLTYIGQVEPQSTVAVSSKVSADVIGVYFDIGDRVNAGDILFQADANNVRHSLAQSQASLSSAQKKAQHNLDMAEQNLETYVYNSENEYNAGVLTAEANLTAAERGLIDAELGLQTAGSNLQSARRKLRDIQDHKNDYLDDDDYERDRRAAQENLTQMEINYESAKYGIEKAELGIEQAEKALEAAKVTADDSVITYENNITTAQLNTDMTESQLKIQQLQESLGDYTIIAPISGVISHRNIEVGQMVSAGSMPFTIISIDNVDVEVEVSETLINNISIGDRVEVVIQALGDNVISGTVRAINPAASTSNTYPIKVEVNNRAGLIKPGMFAQVSFVKDQKANTFVVSKNVILKDENNEYVYVIRDGVAQRRVVTTGISDGVNVEIISGVSVGDEVVVVGQEYLHDGTLVNIVKRDGVAVEMPQPAAPANGNDEDDTQLESSAGSEEQSAPAASSESEDSSADSSDPESSDGDEEDEESGESLSDDTEENLSGADAGEQSE